MLSRRVRASGGRKWPAVLAGLVCVAWVMFAGELLGASSPAALGRLPAAEAQVFHSEASSDAPAADAYGDDDDDDEELDASATNDYPDSENEADDNYEDAEESRKRVSWSPAARRRRHAIWTQASRPRRDIEDRIVLASRREQRKENAREKQEDLDYGVPDDDVDAWVHDGVDDIHIDPETKRAASELSYDEKSIDAEYEPKVHNRTRITTIAEVIPMSVDADDEPNRDSDSTRIVSHWLPASQLSLAQVQALMASHSSSLKATRRPERRQEAHFW